MTTLNEFILNPNSHHSLIRGAILETVKQAGILGHTHIWLTAEPLACEKFDISEAIEWLRQDALRVMTQDELDNGIVLNIGEQGA